LKWEEEELGEFFTYGVNVRQGKVTETLFKNGGSRKSRGLEKEFEEMNISDI